MECQDRIHAIRDRMAADGIDLLIAASAGLHTLDHPDPVSYLTGYRSVGESVFLLYRDGDALLVVSPAADADRLKLRYTTSASLATDDLIAAVKQGITRPANPVAIVNCNALPHQIAQALLEVFGTAARLFDTAFYSIDGRKMNLEIERARSATAIAERGFERLLEIARAGMRECDLALELNCYAKSLGAEDNFLMLNSLSHSRAVMPSSTRRIEPGDILLTELSPNFEGQFSQICRTVSIGRPSDELREKYDLVVRAMWAGIEAVRPGTCVSEVCGAIDHVFESAGYADYCRPPHIRRRGHGLGSGSVSPGDIAIDNHTQLEENMIFVVHPNQYVPEVGYLLCGEPVRVTTTGVEVLSSHTAALRTIFTGQSGAVPCA